MPGVRGPEAGVATVDAAVGDLRYVKRSRREDGEEDEEEDQEREREVSEDVRPDRESMEGNAGAATDAAAADTNEIELDDDDDD